MPINCMYTLRKWTNAISMPDCFCLHFNENSFILIIKMKGMHTPERTCCGCKLRKPKRDMLRVVRFNGGEIEIDEGQIKPGRGAYVCISRSCLEILKEERGLNQSFRTFVPEAVYESIEQFIGAQMTPDILKLLGFARRAGKMKIGKTAALKAIERGESRLVLVASDVSGKIIRELKKETYSRLESIDKERLGQVLGRKEVGILVITDPAFAKSIKKIMHGE